MPRKKNKKKAAKKKPATKKKKKKKSKKKPKKADSPGDELEEPDDIDLMLEEVKENRERIAANKKPKPEPEPEVSMEVITKEPEGKPLIKGIKIPDPPAPKEQKEKAADVVSGMMDGIGNKLDRACADLIAMPFDMFADLFDDPELTLTEKEKEDIAPYSKEFIKAHAPDLINRIMDILFITVLLKIAVKKAKIIRVKKDYGEYKLPGRARTVNELKISEREDYIRRNPEYDD